MMIMAEKENSLTGWQDSPVPKQSSARVTHELNAMTRKETSKHYLYICYL